jgi:hypothetical protein
LHGDSQEGNAAQPYNPRNKSTDCDAHAHLIVDQTISVCVSILQGLQHCALQLVGILNVSGQGRCQLLTGDEAVTICVNMLRKRETEQCNTMVLRGSGDIEIRQTWNADT